MGKNQLTSGDYERILQFISMIRDEKGNFRHAVLKNLSQIFSFHYTTFFLIDQNGQFTSPMGFNISDRLFQLYAEYYFKTDIFYPINFSAQLLSSRDIFTISDLMPLRQFENTEYYKDFLRKDNLYYEIAMPLKLGQQVIGGVGLFRTKDEGDFSPRDHALLTNLSGHISFYLNNFLQSAQCSRQQQLYQNCIAQLPLGLVVFDGQQHVVMHNDIARMYCYDLLGDLAIPDPVEQVIQNWLPKRAFHSIGSSTVTYDDLDSYSIKIVPSIVPGADRNIETCYLLYLAQKVPPAQKQFPPPPSYNLTTRELEITRLIAQGLSNKEIASALFLSANTVRTHIDNMFNKLNVSSRTAILYKLGMLQLG